MRLTKMSRSGTRALFDLAYNNAGIPIQVQEISNRQGIPLRFLEQIFHRLKNANIVKSVKGPHGGYLLARDPQKITVRDIINAVREPIDIVHCVSDTTGCNRSERCITRYVWKDAAEKIDHFFASVSLSDLCKMGKVVGRKKT